MCRALFLTHCLIQHAKHVHTHTFGRARMQTGRAATGGSGRGLHGAVQSSFSTSPDTRSKNTHTRTFGEPGSRPGGLVRVEPGLHGAVHSSSLSTSPDTCSKYTRARTFGRAMKQTGRAGTGGLQPSQAETACRSAAHRPPRVSGALGGASWPQSHRTTAGSALRWRPQSACVRASV